MIRGTGIIGACFDIGKITDPSYGLVCWKVFWQAIGPHEVKGAFLFEGDTRERNVFCIAVQSEDGRILDKVRRALSASPEFKQICATPMFLEGHDCGAEPLRSAGRLDLGGNLVGEAFLSRVSLGGLRRARQPLGTRPPATPARKKPASERTRELPRLSSFDDFKSFVDKTFAARGCRWEHWITPEELCDLVEEYAELVNVMFRESSDSRSEDLCEVSLGPKSPAKAEPPQFVSPVELTGLFPFASIEDAARIGSEYRDSHPSYVRALPELAGIVGRYQFNFGGGMTWSSRWPSDIWYRQEPMIASGDLWPRIWARLRRFAGELETLQQLRIRTIQNERRASGLCVMCGRPLGFLDKLRRVHQHAECGTFGE
jgi:hypothetical protein